MNCVALQYKSFVYFLRIFDSLVIYWKFILKFQCQKVVILFPFWFRKSYAGKSTNVRRCFHSSLKIRANIIFSMVREAHIVSHDPFTFTRRRGWRTEKWGSRANAIHSRVMHATLSRCSLHVSSAAVMNNDTYHVVLHEEISPLQVGLFPHS